jgi:hypothetical protein
MWNETYHSVNEACHENANWIWEFHFHPTNYLMLLNDTGCKPEINSQDKKKMKTNTGN